LHLVTSDDYLRFRSTLQPMLTAGWKAGIKDRKVDFDLNEIIAAARAFIAEKPRTFAEISTMLAELKPDQDIGAMRYGVRMHLHMVQVPTTTAWSFPGNPQFTLAESWLGKCASDKDE